MPMEKGKGEVEVTGRLLSNVDRQRSLYIRRGQCLSIPKDLEAPPANVLKCEIKQVAHL